MCGQPADPMGPIDPRNPDHLQRIIKLAEQVQESSAQAIERHKDVIRHASEIAAAATLAQIDTALKDAATGLMADASVIATDAPDFAYYAATLGYRIIKAIGR